MANQNFLPESSLPKMSAEELTTGLFHMPTDDYFKFYQQEDAKLFVVKGESAPDAYPELARDSFSDDLTCNQKFFVLIDRREESPLRNATGPIYYPGVTMRQWKVGKTKGPGRLVVFGGQDQEGRAGEWQWESPDATVLVKVENASEFVVLTDDKGQPVTGRDFVQRYATWLESMGATKSEIE